MTQNVIDAAGNTNIGPDVVDVPTQTITGNRIREAAQYGPLGQLLAFQWMDCQVPISRMRMSIAHDLVEHKYWGVNGARVENTGMAPTRIHASIPIQNGMTNGRTENWDEEAPYPNLLRMLILAFSRRMTGVLIHPEFDEIPCRAEKLDIDWDAMRRGGCEAEASWIESAQDLDVGTPAFLLGNSPVIDTGDASRSLDSDWEDLTSLVPSLPKFPRTFEDFANDVTGSINQVQSTVNSVKAPVDRFLYRVGQVQGAAERLRSSLTWPVAFHAEQAKFSAQRVRDEGAAGVAKIFRPILRFVVPVASTLAGVQTWLPTVTDLVDIIALNPALMMSPLVPAQTVVRYYGARRGG